MSSILIIPGRGGSGPAHWQSYLQDRLPGARRVLQQDWDHPELDAWAARVDAEVRAGGEPPFAVAHSFGCLALVAAVQKYGTPVARSFLVAPADPARFGLPDDALEGRLPHPSDFLASTDDPWLRLDKAKDLAGRWGSRIHVLGAVGHINVDSGFGPWPEMLRWLEDGRITLQSGTRSRRFPSSVPTAL